MVVVTRTLSPTPRKPSSTVSAETTERLDLDARTLGRFDHLPPLPGGQESRTSSE
jgi:hypothetical protein